jgi:exosortase A-associated hydrolase 2
MNRTRRTVRALLDQAAAAGMAAINLDLRGTGDSSGEFRDASWEGWLDDLALGARWLAEQGCTKIALLGVRAGALLAWDLQGSGRVVAERLVFWQPVLSGKAIVTDLLRARVAAGATAGGAETVGALRSALSRGEDVEAAGYMLTAEFARSLERAVVGPTGTNAWPPGAWFEIAADVAAQPRAAILQAAGRLRSEGARIEVRMQEDPPFWGTVETTTGIGIVPATLQWLQQP